MQLLSTPDTHAYGIDDIVLQAVVDRVPCFQLCMGSTSTTKPVFLESMTVKISLEGGGHP